MVKLAAVVAALALVGAAPPGEPYTIDAILPLTGNSAFSGQIHANALRIYESRPTRAAASAAGRSISSFTTTARTR